MATQIYTGFRNSLGEGKIWKLVSFGQLKVQAVSGSFIFDDSHTQVSQIAGALGTALSITDPAMVDGYVTGTIPSGFYDIPSGSVIAGLVYFYSVGDSAGTTILIGYDPDADGLPLTYGGALVGLSWPDNKILKL